MEVERERTGGHCGETRRFEAEPRNMGIPWCHNDLGHTDEEPWKGHRTSTGNHAGGVVVCETGSAPCSPCSEAGHGRLGTTAADPVADAGLGVGIALRCSKGVQSIEANNHI